MAIVMAAGTYFAWRSHERGGMVRAGRPAVPDLQGWPDELRRRIAAAAGRDSVGALAELSRLYHANGFLNEARRCYESLEKIQPTEPRWPHRHASILAGYGDAEPAGVRWRRVVELAPDYLPARLRLGELLAKTERAVEAAQVFHEVLRRAPDDAHARLGLARLDLEAGRWTEARQRLEAVATQTNYELGYDLLVTVYEHFGQQEQAVALRGRAKALGSFRDPPDPWLDELMEDCFEPYRLSLAAGAASRSGRNPAALRLLERAVAIAPSDVSIRFQLAGEHAARGDGPRARAELERCTVLVPGFADPWAHLSAMFERSGDARAAEQTLAAGLRHCPESPGLRLMHARRLRDAGRHEEAIREYRAAIRFRPNEAEAYVELASTLFRLERVGEGRNELEKALAAEPGHPMALALLALHAIGERDEPAARKWLAAALGQPRLPREQQAQLRAAFRDQFGREFR